MLSEVFSILLVVLDVFNSIRVECLASCKDGQHLLYMVFIPLVFDARDQASPDQGLHVISHLDDIRWAVALVYQVQLFAKGSCLVLTLIDLQNTHVPNPPAVEEASKSLQLEWTIDTLIIVDDPVLALPLASLAVNRDVAAVTVSINVRVILSISLIIGLATIATSPLLIEAIFAVFSKSSQFEGLDCIATVACHLAIAYQRHGLRN